MPENNQILSVEGQLVGMPLAGPESFSQAQLAYLKQAIGVDETLLFEATTLGAISGTLSEAYTNFERIRIEVGAGNQSGTDGCSFVEISPRYSVAWMMYGFGGGGSNAYYAAAKIGFTSATTWSVDYGSSILHSESSTSVSGNTQYNTTAKTCVWRIWGIHRISGGNE